MKKADISNEEIADKLEHVADLLELQDENAFRVRSYRAAAQTVRDLNEPVADFVPQDGQRRLRELPGIGRKLAGSIEEIVTTGHLGLEERLEGEVRPGESLTRVPGIGEKLADRIREQLGVTTLEELELAAHDGRLEKVEGIGPDQAEGVRVALSGMLSRSSQRSLRQRVPPGEEEVRPSVRLLLEIDEEYRTKAGRDQLRKLAPKRFNPQGEAWLPVMNVDRRGWSFTVLFSNTALAHKSGKTHDWVVIYYERSGQEHQCTVVTAARGPLEGKRVIRGRERECRAYYSV